MSDSGNPSAPTPLTPTAARPMRAVPLSLSSSDVVAEPTSEVRHTLNLLQDGNETQPMGYTLRKMEGPALSASLEAFIAETQHPDQGSQEMFDLFMKRTERTVRTWHVRSARAEDTDRLAVIIEPRQHPAFEYVVKNVMHFVGQGWALQIFHGANNYDFVRDKLVDENGTLPENITFSQIIWNGTAKADLNITEYNALRAHPAFYQAMHEKHEHILIFETDAVLLKPLVLDDSIFSEYDLVGAPWQWCRDRALPQAGAWCDNGANGGLTLRRRSKCLECLLKYPYQGGPEDMYLVANLPKLGGRIAPYKISKAFSVESIFDKDPVGVHKPWLYMDKHQMGKLLEKAARYVQPEYFEFNSSIHSVLFVFFDAVLAGVVIFFLAYACKQHRDRRRALSAEDNAVPAWLSNK